MLGTHWEWRGFGRATPGLRTAVESLEPLFQPQEVVDRYIWIPGSSVNVKLRTGVQDGLKFKRLLEKDGDLELWLEDPEELFDFPLGGAAWEKLCAELHRAGLEPPGTPRVPSDLSTTLKRLRGADKRIGIVEVHKKRRARLWRGEEGTVLVEWARITRPERIHSVSLENWTGLADSAASAGLADPPVGGGDRDAIQGAIRHLGLEAARLRPMSYLAATEVWAGGRRIGP